MNAEGKKNSSGLSTTLIFHLVAFCSLTSGGEEVTVLLYSVCFKYAFRSSINMPSHAPTAALRDIKGIFT